MIGERAAPLLEDAAERSRISLRTRLQRLLQSWRSVVQAALSAGLAWLLATQVLGHQRPFFAPVSAIVTLGLTVTERGRRAFELAVAVPLGIAIADLLVLVIGTGAAQLALVVLLAYAVALLVGRGQLLATQTAVSAALVATLQPPQGGITFSRALDGLVGAGVALLIGGLVLPVDPRKLLRAAARPVLAELAATLEDVAAALEARSLAGAQAALDRARGIDDLEVRFADAIRMSREAARYAPPHRGELGRVESYAGAAEQIDLAVRNVRVLARAAVRAITLDDNVPPDVSAAIRELAVAARRLGDVIEGEAPAPAAREPALRAAARATAVLERTGNMSVSVVVGQIRSTASDLLTASGLPHDQASAAVRRAAQGH